MYFTCWKHNALRAICRKCWQLQKGLEGHHQGKSQHLVRVPGRLEMICNQISKIIKWFKIIPACPVNIKMVDPHVIRAAFSALLTKFLRKHHQIKIESIHGYTCSYCIQMWWYAMVSSYFIFLSEWRLEELPQSLSLAWSPLALYLPNVLYCVIVFFSIVHVHVPKEKRSKCCQCT